MKAVFATLLPAIYSTAAAETKDTLWLRNKTVLIGELKRIKLGRIEFDADDVSLANIKYDKIDSIKAATHAYRVETLDRQLLFGTLGTTGKSGYVTLHSPTKNTQLLLENISELTYYGHSWKSRLSGGINLGYTYTRLSRIGRLNYAAKMRVVANRWEANFNSTSIVTRDTVKRYRERDDYSLNVFYMFNQRWFGGTMMKFQKSVQLGIASRWQEGVGVGNKLINGKTSRGTVIGGLVINQERAFNKNKSKLLWEWALQAGYQFFSFEKPKLNLSLTETAYAGLTQSNRLRLDGELKGDWEFIDDFTLNLTLYQNFDSKSPAKNGSSLDYGIVFGVGYTF